MATTDTQAARKPLRSYAQTSKKRSLTPQQGPLSLEKTSMANRPFSRINFIMMGCCLLLIIIGFLLMAGPGSTVEGGFNPDIFSTRRIVAGPTLAFLGFLLMAFAIVWRPGKEKKQSDK